MPTCEIGGFGGPGAMKATVLAVALLATTGSYKEEEHMGTLGTYGTVVW